MQTKSRTFLFFVIVGTLLLFPSFNGDGWGMVREYDYRGWQTTSERVWNANSADGRIASDALARNA